MHDLLDEDLKYLQKIEKASQEMADFYGFERIETPILEDSSVFEKGTGQSTDVVQKQMFVLRTRGGNYLTLRPEGTPSVVRAYLEHGMESLPKPVKLWYFGPFFRYERPQAGRYRQFWQVGFEAIGSDSWITDVQIIQILYNILKGIGLKNLMLNINSIGDSQCRPYYKKVLINYLRSYRNSLCSDCRRRLRQNPLRVLDCKEEKCRRVVKKGAPQILDHLCKPCHNHFRNVLEALEELELSYNLDPYLVRGLDYYTKTVFEISQESEEGRIQGSVAGGGRYDDLVKLLGGKETASVGGTLGVDRIMNLIKKGARKFPRSSGAKIFLAQVGEFPKRKALKLLEEFRKEKIKAEEALHKDSLSVQLKLADKLKVSYVLILGQKEALDEKIIVRDMKTGSQKIIPLNKAVKEMKRKMKK